MGRRWDILAWNRAALSFYLDFEQVPANERNMLWLIFTHAAMRSLLVDWRKRAQDTLARFRSDYGRHAGDAHFVQLVERLKSVSPEFAQWWPRHDILPITEGRNAYDHPIAGRMIVEHTTFSVSDNPELRLVVCLPAAASNSKSPRCENSPPPRAQEKKLSGSRSLPTFWIPRPLFYGRGCRPPCGR